MPSAFNYGPTVGSDASWTDLGDNTAFEFADGEPFTISCWVKYENQRTGTYDVMAMGKAWWAGPSYSEYYLARYRTDGGVAQFVCHNGEGDAGTINSDDAFLAGGSEGAPADGDWYHLIGTRNASNVCNMYVNGVQQAGTVTVTGAVGTSTNHLGIGSRNNAGSPDVDDSNWQGYIRDARIYSSGLTALESAQLFNDTYTDTTALEGWWKLDGDFLDSSGNGRNGTQNTSTGYWNSSIYNLNQIGSGSRNSSTTISGGTWNLRDSTTFTNLNGTSAYYDLGDSSNIITGTTVTYSIWFNCTDGDAASMYLMSNMRPGGSTNMSLTLNRDDTGSGDAGQLSGFLWNGATHVFAAYDAAINDGEWHNAVYTTSGSVQGLYLDGVQVAAGSGTFANEADTTDMSIGSFNDGGSDFFDGDISTTIIDDKAWTAEQVALYYKGQWVGNPAHMFKFNEGAGNASDSGRGSVTAQQQVATWVKSDYFIAASTSTNGRTTIDTNGTLSAPQGHLVFGLSGQVSQQFYNHGTYIHNSGTVSATGAVEVHVIGGSNTAFYDITSYGPALAGIGGVRPYVDMTLENSALNGPNTEFQFSGIGDQNKTVTLGTQTSSALIGCTYWDGNSGVANFTVSGVSAAHPAIISSSCSYSRLLGVSGSENYMCGNVNVINVDASQRDIFYGKTDVAKKITLLGDFSAKNIWLEVSGTMDLSGNRLECTTYRQWDGPGATSGTTKGSMIVYTGTPVAQYGSAYPVPHTIGYGGGATSLTGTSILFNTTLGAETRINWNSSVNPKYSFTNVLGTPTYVLSAAMNDQQGAHERFIIGNGVYTGYGSGPAWTYNLACKDFFVATGGQYDPSGRIAGDGDDIVVSGAFNLAGGFIGKGAMDFSNGPSSGADSADEYLLGASGQTFTEAGITMEAWFRGTNTDAIQYIFDGYFTGGYKYNYIAISAAGKFQAVAAGMGTTETLYSTTTITDGAWHHLAYTFYDAGGGGNDNIGRLYIDGKMEAESYLLESGGSPYTLNTFSIGAANDNAGGYSYGLSGALARVSVWKTALTAADIREMMFYDWAAIDASSIDETTCFTWYEFSDSQAGTSVSDMSGSGNTGTLSATGAWVSMTDGATGPILGEATGGDGGLFFKNSGGTCTYTSAVTNPSYNHPFRMKSLNITSGTTLDKEDIGSYTSSVYFSMTDKNFNLYSGSTFGTADGHIDLLSMKLQAVTSGQFYVEPDVSFGSWGIKSDGNPNYLELPHSSSTASSLNFDKYLSISDSTVTNINKDLNITAADGLYIGRASNTTLKAGNTLNVVRVRPQGSPDSGGMTFVMEAGSTVGVSGGTSGFCDNDATDRALENFLVSGEKAAIFTNNIAPATEAGWPFEGQVSLSGTLPTSMDTASLASGSMSYWCKTPQIGVSGAGFDPIFSFKDNGNGWGILVYNNYSVKKITAYIEDDNNSGFSWQQGIDLGAWDSDHSAYWSDTGWNHLMMTFESGQAMQFWLNGVGYSTETYTDAPGGGMVISGAIDSSDAYISMGARGLIPLQGSYISGSMADVRIYHKALTSGNMVTLYDGGVCAASSATGVYPDADNALGAEVWWKMDATGSYSGYEGLNKLDEVSGAAWAGWQIVSENPALYTSDNINSGFAKIYRRDAGDYKIFPDQIKTGTNGTLDYQFTNLYVTGAQDLVIADGQSLKTKGTVVLD